MTQFLHMRTCTQRMCGFIIAQAHSESLRTEQMRNIDSTAQKASYLKQQPQLNVFVLCSASEDSGPGLAAELLAMTSFLEVVAGGCAIDPALCLLGDSADKTPAPCLRCLEAVLQVWYGRSAKT